MIRLFAYYFALASKRPYTKYVPIHRCVGTLALGTIKPSMPHPWPAFSKTVVCFVLCAVQLIGRHLGFNFTVLAFIDFKGRSN